MKKNKKTNILFDATGGSKWIGGLYYKKNVIYALLENEKFNDKYKIVVVTDEENKSVFIEFEPYIKIVTIKYSSNREKIVKNILAGLTNQCKYLFPYWGKKCYSYFGIKEIYWIADFQECHYPEFFTKEMIETRKKINGMIVNKGYPLILSSQDALNDLNRFYGKNDNIYVMHFVSDIKNEVESLSPDFEESTLKKYQLHKKGYMCVCNQFWQHKNHAIVIEAIRILKKRNKQIRVVFTGNINDNRSDAYISRLKKALEDETISNMITVTGFISRKEQLAIIKNSKCVIQPSLFEGWGTVLEDSKVLDKVVLLSDIPVHQEQKSNKSILFNPHNPVDLANKMLDVVKMQDVEDLDQSLVRMRNDSIRYADEFVNLLRHNG